MQSHTDGERAVEKLPINVGMKFEIMLFITFLFWICLQNKHEVINSSVTILEKYCHQQHLHDTNNWFSTIIVTCTDSIFIEKRWLKTVDRSNLVGFI